MEGKIHSPIGRFAERAKLVIFSSEGVQQRGITSERVMVSVTTSMLFLSSGIGIRRRSKTLFARTQNLIF